MGCSVAEIAKTLVFRGGDRAVVAIMSGDNRLDTGKLAAALGEPVGRADADYVRAATGFAIGGVPPLGYAAPVDVFMDADLFRFSEVWAGGREPVQRVPGRARPPARRERGKGGGSQGRVLMEMEDSGRC